LRLLGDPEFAAVGTMQLLSKEYALEQAGKITAALKERKPIPLSIDDAPDHGTVNLSCCDAAGNLAAMTLTHGDSFGAQVTVPGLGLTLGHGMSRFDPRPGRANSVAGKKRPLHNMCPTIIARGGRPVFAVGGAGGRKIPNAIYQVLLHYLESDGSATGAIEGPRCHLDRGVALTVEARWPEAEIAYLKSVGYNVQKGASALVSAAWFDPESAECRSAMR
jgi:gamma-glutamyltranspeptidase/glutathione hydrolase